MDFEKLGKDIYDIITKNTPPYLFLQYLSTLDLKATSYRVILYILPDIATNEYCKITQSIICEELKMRKSEVSLAIKELVDKGVLISKPNTKNNSYLKLSYSNDTVRE